MALLRSVLLIIIVLYLGIVAFMYLQQRSLQYFPARTGTSPQALGLSGVTEERVPTPDGETIVLWYAPAQPGKPTVLFFHGNGGEIAGRHERFAFFQAQGLGVMFVSYRGYGASTGTISEQGLVTDALTANALALGLVLVAPASVAVTWTVYVLCVSKSSVAALTLS